MDLGFIQETLMEQGVLGAILIYFMVQNKVLVRQLLKIIENNTKALSEMKTIVGKCSKKDG